MATNQITIVFEDCEPIGGYYIFYRPIGNLDPHRAAGPFFSSPIIINDVLDPANQEYEGYIQSHCGGGIFGDQIPWETSGSPSVPGSEPGAECCDPTIITGTATTIIPDGSLPGSGSDIEPCCTPFIISACIETIAESGSGSESGSESGSGSEPPPDTDGIMHLFSAESYAILSLKDLAYWNTRYDTVSLSDTPFDEIVLFPDDLKIVLKGATNLTLNNAWEDFQEESLGLKGFWDNSGSIPNTTSGCFLGAVNLEVVEMFYTTDFATGVFEGCTGLLSVGLPIATTLDGAVFQGCSAIQTINLPAATTLGNSCFNGCTSLETIGLPVCSALGDTTGDNNVFNAIIGNTITLTILTATATDGDVVELQANNTVTLILV